MDMKILITQLNHEVQNDMKAGNLIWDEIIDAGGRYIHSLRESLAAQVVFADSLSKLSSYSSKSGLSDLASVLSDFVQKEKLFVQSQNTKSSTLDGVIQPLRERVIEWRKVSRDDSPSYAQNQAKRLIRKGSSTENIINKMGSVMTLSRKSRKPSRDRKDNSKGSEVEFVGRDTLESSVTERGARVSTFLRSMIPYIHSNLEVSQTSHDLAKLKMAHTGPRGHNSVNEWIDGRIVAMSSGHSGKISKNYDTILRHNRKSSISSISSSKSDSNSSGSGKINEVENKKTGIRLQSSENNFEYRLSTTSHDSGFTSHETQESESNNNEIQQVRGRLNSWKDWPKPGPYDVQFSENPDEVPPYENRDKLLNLPAPPPALLVGMQIPATEPLNISCSHSDQAPPHSPSRSSSSSAASMSLSPYPTVIESGIATIRRKPTQVNRFGVTNGGTIPRIPSIPASPGLKPPLPPRQGSILKSE